MMEKKARKAKRKALLLSQLISQRNQKAKDPSPNLEVKRRARMSLPVLRSRRNK